MSDDRFNCTQAVLTRFFYLALFSVCLLIFQISSEFRLQAGSVSGGSYNNGFEYDTDFDAIDQYFASPPNKYRITQYQMNKVITDATLGELLDYGIGGVQLSVNYNNYLMNEMHWQRWVSEVELANQHGIRVWVHDERGYPSGMAGGLVVEGHPEYENRGLIRIIKEGYGQVEVIHKLPNDIDFIYAVMHQRVNGNPDFTTGVEVPIVNSNIKTTGMEGYWQLSAFGVIILDENTQAQSTLNFGHSGRYPSLLNKEAVERFVALTHQQYADRIGDIGRKVDAFYSNEPNLMTTYWQYDGTEAEYAYIPWEQGLPDRFQGRHGYDLFPLLDALFGGEADDFRMVRLHFYQTVGDMFTSAYAETLAEWCTEHGVKSSGHLLLEEHLACHVIYYGDFMQAMRAFHMPACDLPIARSTLAGWEFWMPKFISSAAYLEDNYGTVAALLCPIIRHGRDDLSPDIGFLKRTVNMAAFCGINHFSTYIFIDGYSPEEYRHFNDYIGRLTLMLRGAKSEAPVAMYYPIKTMQSHYIVSPLNHNRMRAQYFHLQAALNQMAANMLQHGLDFNYLTDDVILDATVSNGYLETGRYRYAALVMPRVEVIPLEVMQKLKEIADAGIPVFWIESLPSLGVSNNEHEAVRDLASSFSINNDPMPALKNIRDNVIDVHFGVNDDKLFVSRYSKDNHMIYYIINDAEHQITITAESVKNNKVSIYNPVDGEIWEEELPFSLDINSYESLFVVAELDASLVSVKRDMKITSESITLFPNPATSSVNIEVPAELTGTTMLIMDMTGQVVDKETIMERSFSKDLSVYLPGVYFLLLQNGTVVKKMVVM